MIGLDTNVVVRFLVGDDPAQTQAARALFDSLRPDNPGYLSLVVWVETYWVLTRTYAQPSADVVAVLADLLSSDEIVSQSEAEVRGALRDAADGADLGDALIARIARVAGCTESVTFDKKAAKSLGFRLL
ncbi:MAG: type II toxin-antitoxin system VapC family toxin [Micrococcales bacterium]|nr:type II toxin-antitoxin system VapC family toxin [Micrococcales bacterium]